MNKKISPTLIGGFVLGAVALLVIAVIAFGSGRLFRKTKEFVVYSMVPSTASISARR